MFTSLSTESTMFWTMLPPIRNAPMISNDRKIVTMDPNVVDRCLPRPFSASRR